MSGVVARALFVGKDRDLQGTAGADTPIVQRARDFERRQHSQVPVVTAAVPDRVDVGSEHHRGSVRIVPGPPADDVPDPVHPDQEAGILHPRADQIAARTVLGGEGQPLGATLGGGADFREPGERVQQAGTVDVELRLAAAHRDPLIPRRRRRRTSASGCRQAARATRRSAPPRPARAAGRRYPGSKRGS